MSFRCGHCDKAQETGTRPNRVITEIRQRTYHTNYGIETLPGWEIVKEESLCVGCFAKCEVVQPPSRFVDENAPLRAPIGDGIHNALRRGAA